MLRKNKKKNMTSSAMVAGGRKDNTIPSVITKDMHMLGNIVGDGIVDFDGALDGNIRCTILTIRANGSVKGEVVADHVSVYGRVNGLIRARTVHMHAGCHVEGIIMHEALTIDDGAFVDGKFKRTDRLQHEDVIEHKSSVPFEADEDDGDSESSAASAKLLKNIRLIQ